MSRDGLLMGRKEIWYMRVHQQVVQVEIFPFLTPAHSQVFPRNWFSQYHSLEVKELLQPSLSWLVSCDYQTKDKELKQAVQDCLVGSTVRLGFNIKRKPERQWLLVPSSKGDRPDCQIFFLKLVVYVCPRSHSSTSKVNLAFSQLVTVERQNPDQQQISSYFLRIPERQPPSITLRPGSSNSVLPSSPTAVVTTASSSSHTTTSVTTTAATKDPVCFTTTVCTGTVPSAAVSNSVSNCASVDSYPRTSDIKQQEAYSPASDFETDNWCASEVSKMPITVAYSADSPPREGELAPVWGGKNRSWTLSHDSHNSKGQGRMTHQKEKSKKDKPATLFNAPLSESSHAHGSSHGTSTKPSSVGGPKSSMKGSHAETLFSSKDCLLPEARPPKVRRKEESPAPTKKSTGKSSPPCSSPSSQSSSPKCHPDKKSSPKPSSHSSFPLSKSSTDKRKDSKPHPKATHKSGSVSKAPPVTCALDFHSLFGPPLLVQNGVVCKDSPVVRSEPPKAQPVSSSLKRKENGTDGVNSSHQKVNVKSLNSTVPSTHSSYQNGSANSCNTEAPSVIQVSGGSPGAKLVKPSHSSGVTKKKQHCREKVPSRCVEKVPSRCMSVITDDDGDSLPNVSFSGTRSRSANAGAQSQRKSQPSPTPATTPQISKPTAHRVSSHQFAFSSASGFPSITCSTPVNPFPLARDTQESALCSRIRAPSTDFFDDDSLPDLIGSVYMREGPSSNASGLSRAQPSSSVSYEQNEVLADKTHSSSAREQSSARPHKPNSKSCSSKNSRPHQQQSTSNRRRQSPTSEQTGKQRSPTSKRPSPPTSSDQSTKRQKVTEVKKSSNSIQDIPDEELERQVFSMRGELMALYNGEVENARVRQFKQGGRQQRQLDDQVHLHHFREGQEDVVMDALLKIFTQSQLQNLEFIMRVMLPEALSRIYKKVMGISWGGEP